MAISFGELASSAKYPMSGPPSLATLCTTLGPRLIYLLGNSLSSVAPLPLLVTPASITTSPAANFNSALKKTTRS